MDTPADPWFLCPIVVWLCRWRRCDRSYNDSSLLLLNSNCATGAKALYRHTDIGTSATAQSLSFQVMLPRGPLSVWNFSHRWMSDCGVLIPTLTWSQNISLRTKARPETWKHATRQSNRF